MGVATAEGGYAQTTQPTTAGTGERATTQRVITSQVLPPPAAAGQAAAIRAEREALRIALNGLIGPDGLSDVFASRANFVLVRVAGAAGRSLRIAERIRDSGVLIKDVSRMDPSLDQCLRLTVGLPDENRQLIDALRQALEHEPAAA